MSFHIPALVWDAAAFVCRSGTIPRCFGPDSQGTTHTQDSLMIGLEAAGLKSVSACWGVRRYGPSR